MKNLFQSKAAFCIAVVGLIACLLSFAIAVARRNPVGAIIFLLAGISCLNWAVLCRKK